MFELVVFDLDGVLWVSNDAHVDVCRRALMKAGLDGSVDSSRITDFFGLPYREVLRAVMGDSFSEEKLEIAYMEQQRLLYDDGFFERVRRIDGVEALLSDLRGVGVKLAVASGNQRRFLVKALGFLGVLDFFDVVLSADDVVCSKPDPEMLLKAVAACGSHPSASLFVGDAKNDVLAAKAANMCSAVVLTGALGLAEAEALDPDFVLDSVLDLDKVFSL